jgi:uncharacterized repeat protein (TIGR01451 family)
MLRMATGLLAAMLLTGLGAETVAAQETADLQITKVAAQKTVRVGETVTYTVTVTNLGPGIATGVVFGDSPTGPTQPCGLDLRCRFRLLFRRESAERRQRDDHDRCDADPEPRAWRAAHHEHRLRAAVRDKRS